MKSKTQELLDKSIAAMVSSIEIYNKPDFLYRGETFAILAINSWELLFKAKTLHANSNRIESLYVPEAKFNKDGKKSKRKGIKRTRSGNPFTHGIDFLGKKHINDGCLDPIVYKNIEALIELRDSAVHFYNYSTKFNIRLQEIGTASLRNYVKLIKLWFNKDLSEYNFYLMPLSFVTVGDTVDLLILNNEEKNFVTFLDTLEDDSDKLNSNSEYSIALNLEIAFSRSKSKDAINAVLSNDPNAMKITHTYDQMREKYPLDYKKLTNICKERYCNFVVNNGYHNIRKNLEKDNRFAHERRLDPNNSRSAKKTFYSYAILDQIDKHYIRSS